MGVVLTTSDTWEARFSHTTTYTTPYCTWPTLSYGVHQRHFHPPCISPEGMKHWAEGRHLKHTITLMPLNLMQQKSLHVQPVGEALTEGAFTYSSSNVKKSSILVSIDSRVMEGRESCVRCTRLSYSSQTAGGPNTLL